jgi:cytochrome c
MSSFEWNKIIASVLTALIVAMVSGLLADQLIRPEKPAKPVFLVAGTPAAAPNAAAPAGPKPIEPLLAKADPKKGQALTTACQACHTFGKGEANKIGPNLYGVYGAKIAEGRNGYDFSTALQAHKGKVWDADTLNQWLYDPQKFASGTKMTFPGIKNDRKRADVIAYLHSISPSAPPLPKAAPASAQKAAAAAPAKPNSDIDSLLKKANVKKGKSLATVCLACHSFGKGEANKIGPNLYGVVGSKIAEDRQGYAFSSALAAHKGQTWDPKTLDKWLADPQKFAAGTKMTFAGIQKPQDRADVIAYLETFK